MESHDEQSRLLDLIEVFREYTEKGRLYKASNIIATQVANLESATRRIETKAKDLAKDQPKVATTSYATVAATGSQAMGTQEWTQVSKTKVPKDIGTIAKAKANSLKARRLVLICPPSQKDT